MLLVESTVVVAGVVVVGAAAVVFGVAESTFD